LPNEVSAHQVCKGFVAGVSMLCEDFQRHASELFSKHPITEVILTNKHPEAPYGGDDLYFLFDEDNWPSVTDRTNLLPHGVYELLVPDVLNHAGNKGFTSPDRAARALSQALVRYGRGLVQPPLPELVFPAPESQEEEMDP
jgi:hypothetical protein